MMALSRSKFRVVYEAMLEILRTDPVLSSADINYLMFEGEHKRSDFRPPNQRIQYWVRILPNAGETDWGMTGTLRTPFRYQVELTAFSSDVGDILDLWGGIIDAIYPSDAGRREEVRGIWERVRNENPGLDVMPAEPVKSPFMVAPDQDKTCLRGVGYIEADVYIDYGTD